MLIYGHRGARGEAPENTLAGFRQALQAGVSRVELDVRLSRDADLVVIHDDSVDRTTTASGPVEQFTSAELARLDARRGWPDWPEPQSVPTLRRVLEAFPQLQHLQLEVKPTTAERHPLIVQGLRTLFHDFGLYQRAVVTSFDQPLLATLRLQARQLPIGFVSGHATPDPLAIAHALGAYMLVLDRNLCSRKRVQEAQALGMVVSAWTVNDEHDMREMFQLGVDSIVTDYPSRAVALQRTLSPNGDQCLRGDAS